MTPNLSPSAGALVQLSSLASSRHQHYFFFPMTDPAPTDIYTLSLHDALPISNPPTEVMLQWNDGTWEHRAYWGANTISWGVDRSEEHTSELQSPDHLVCRRLLVTTELVGLEGRTLNGMAFTLQDGRATWDRAG